jgi:hypothetical protein
MKRTRFVAAAVLGALAFILRAGAQPATVADTLYLEDFREGLGQSVNVLWLRADGTYQLLSNDLRTTSNGVAGSLGSQDVVGSGSYTYAPSPSDHTATLVLGSVTRKLFFTTANTGSLIKSLPGGDFEVLPRIGNPRANLSLRGRVQGNTGPIAGLVVNDIQWALIRVVGPGLTKFGVANPASNPTFTLTSNGTTMFTKSGWDTAAHELETVFRLTGAFPLDRGSADAALLVRLTAGTHTLQVLSTGTDGEVLIEVYYMPFNY